MVLILFDEIRRLTTSCNASSRDDRTLRPPRLTDASGSSGLKWMPGWKRGSHQPQTSLSQLIESLFSSPYSDGTFFLPSQHPHPFYHIPCHDCYTALLLLLFFTLWCYRTRRRQCIKIAMANHIFNCYYN